MIVLGVLFTCNIIVGFEIAVMFPTADMCSIVSLAVRLEQCGHVSYCRHMQQHFTGCQIGAVRSCFLLQTCAALFHWLLDWSSAVMFPTADMCSIVSLAVRLEQCGHVSYCRHVQHCFTGCQIGAVQSCLLL